MQIFTLKILCELYNFSYSYRYFMKFSLIIAFNTRCINYLFQYRKAIVGDIWGLYKTFR